MDMKRLVTGGIVGGLGMFAMGYVMYVILLAGFFEANSTSTGVSRAPDYIWWSIILGEVFMGMLIMQACDWAGSTGWQACAKTGAIVGLLAWAGQAFIMYGAADMATLTATIVDPLVTMVRAGVAGALIGMVVAKGGSAASASEY